MIFNNFASGTKIVVNFFQRHRYHNQYLNYYYKNLKIYNLFPLFDLSPNNTFLNNLFFKINWKFREKIMLFVKKKLGNNHEYFHTEDIVKLTDYFINNNIDKKKEYKDKKIFKRGIISIREPYINFFSKKKQLQIQPQKKIKYFFKKKFKNINYNKTVCFNLRSKAARDNYTELRNGCDIKLLLKSFNYLLKNNYFVIVTGDFNHKSLLPLQNEKLLFSEKYKIEKNFFDLYFQTMSKYNICQAGGGNIVNMINKNEILLIDMWPVGYFLPNAQIYYKKVRFKGKYIDPKKIIFEDIKKNRSNFKKLSKYQVYYKDNLLRSKNINFYESKDYLNFIKIYIKNFKRKKYYQSKTVKINELKFLENKFNFKIMS